MRIVLLLVVSACTLAVSSCVMVAPAPGADKVHLTQTAADVNGCTAVGNLHLTNAANDLPHAAGILRNEVIGLGGNTAFVTTGSLVTPTDGVAYK